MSSALNSCDIKTSGGITIVTLLEEFDFQMGLEVIQYLSDHELYQYRIIDYNGFSWHINHSDILRMSNFSKSVFPERNVVAFTASNDLAYGSLRELSVFREQDGHSQVGVFRSLEESVQWMAEQKAVSDANPPEPIQ